MSIINILSFEEVLLLFNLIYINISRITYANCSYTIYNNSGVSNYDLINQLCFYFEIITPDLKLQTVIKEE